MKSIPWIRPFGGCTDYCSLAKTLQEKLEKKDSLTKTLREKLVELKKALTDCVELMKSNQDLNSEVSRIHSQFEAEKGENSAL